MDVAEKNESARIRAVTDTMARQTRFVLKKSQCTYDITYLDLEDVMKDESKLLVCSVHRIESN